MDNCEFEIRGKNYRFWAFGGPIDAASDYPELFQAIGHAVASWARMEHMLDALLVHLNKEAYAQELYEADYPRNFSRKADLLKSWFKGHPELQSHADSVMEVMPRIKTTAHTRHLLAHASIESYDAKSGEITFKTIKPKGDDNFLALTETLNIKGVQTVATLANTANKFLAALGLEVFGPDADIRFQTPQRRRLWAKLVRRLRSLACPTRNR